MRDQLQAFIQEQGFEKSYCVAYSGGLDSQVLLQLCAVLRKQKFFSLRAIHVHHGLSAQADLWAEHCHQTCQALQVPLTALRVNAVPPPGESLEAYARGLRYAAIKEALTPGEILLTAHHEDDQAETLLLQLLRGAGPKGLSAMPAMKSFGQGLLARPFLAYSRADLKAYAEEEKLTWVEDELNQDPRYTRNQLRHGVLALLKQDWPAATKTLARSASLCAEAQSLLEEYADRDLTRLSGSRPGTLSVKRLLELSPAKQRLIVRRWFEVQGRLLPSAAKLHQMQESVFLAKGDRQPCVSWGEVQLRRHRDDLYLLQIGQSPQLNAVYTWDLKAPLLIPGLGCLRAEEAVGQGLQLCPDAVEVRFRQGGESYRLQNGRQRELKKFFQEQGVPPWERERLPLIYAAGELIAIPGYWVVDQFRAAANELGWSFSWAQ